MTKTVTLTGITS